MRVRLLMSDFSEYGSRYNWLANSVREFKRKDTVIIDDLTLEGDGEEMAGVAISDEDKIAIATQLSEIGVSRIRVLGPKPRSDEISIVEEILSLGLPVQIGSLVQKQEDIEISAQIGLWGVLVNIGVSAIRIPDGKTEMDVIEESKRLTRFAKKQGLHTCFLMGDTTHTRPEFLKQLILAVQENCDELGFADSGAVSPFGFRYLIEQVTSWTKLPVSVHCHNGSSMAVANALACVLGGASVLHTTVNGLGELSGLLPLEEIAVALPMHLGVSTGIKLEGLKSTSELVAHATGVPVSIQKPVVGDNFFCIPETWVSEELIERARKGLLEKSLVYPPRLVGNQMQIPIGSRCNEFTVRYYLGIHGWTANQATIQTIVEAVHRKVAKAEGYYLMEESEFVKIVQEEEFKLIPIQACACGDKS